jgi:hypothetical protein
MKQADSEVVLPSSECSWWWLLRQHSDRGQIVLLSICFPWSFKLCEAQIDNKACGTWLSVSDKPLSLEHLEPLNKCIFLAGSRVAIFLCFYIYTMQGIIKDDECFFILFFMPPQQVDLWVLFHKFICMGLSNFMMQCKTYLFSLLCKNKV